MSVSSNVQIISPSLAMQALRDNSYKSTANCVAELIDNSIDAQADQIDIVSSFDHDIISGDHYTIKALAIIDNGNGMNIDVLQKCLSLGRSNAAEDKSQLGHYGFGLKGASINQCRRVDIYSWQDGHANSNLSYLDLDEVEKEGQQFLPKVTKTKIPENYLKYIDEFKKSGTLVLWSKIDKMKARRPKSFVEASRPSALIRDLSRVFRHFLDDDDTYGKKKNISVHTVDSQGKNINNPSVLIANDPLYLLTPHNTPLPEKDSSLNEDHYINIAAGYKKEALSELFDDDKVEVETPDGAIAYNIRISSARPSVQKLGGNSPTGQHYEKNTGISFLRNEREIDLSMANYGDRSDPRNRWWGIEVRFPATLDTYFGITHDKQQVKNVNKLESYESIDLKDEYSSKAKSMWTESDYIDQFKVEFNNTIIKYISSVNKRIRARGVGTRNPTPGQEGVIDVVNETIKSKNREDASTSIAAEKTDEEKLAELIIVKKKEDVSISDDEARKRAERSLKYKVDLALGDWPGDVILDREFKGGGVVGRINRNSEFFKYFYDYLNEMNDKKAIEALNILLICFIRAEDELIGDIDEDDLKRFRERWGFWIEQTIKHAGN